MTTAIHSMAVDRAPNLPIERRTLHYWTIAAPEKCSPPTSRW